MRRQVFRWTSRLLRGAALSLVIARLAAGGRAKPPVGISRGESGGQGASESSDPLDATISVIIPARDEARRIGPLLDRVVGAPSVAEVIVIDDESTDATADVARAAGATVIDGTAAPSGWAGKPWALQQGIEAASGTWIVALDADTRPDPSLMIALTERCRTDAIDLLTVGGRFDCPTGPARWLHAAMLTTLVYRYGPPGVPRSGASRLLANGQCMAARREFLRRVGGFESVAHHVVEDVALGRRLAEDGWSVQFLDASDLLTVRMYESFEATWVGWGRSLGLPGVEARSRQFLDVTTLILTQVLPLPRLLLGRGDAIDVVALAVRAGTLAGTSRAYRVRDLAYWASPAADAAAVAAVLSSLVRREQTWRGRRYLLRARPAGIARRSGS